MAFHGTLLDLFQIPPGTVLIVGLHAGEPTIGDRVETVFGSGKIIGLDGKGVQSRAGLDGQPSIVQIGIVTDLPFPEGEVVKTDIRSLPGPKRKGA